MFIQDDEYILLMQDSLGGRFTLDDLKRLRDIGVQTIVYYPFWRDIEVSLREYQWRSIDDAIQLARKAGMKSLFALYDHAPDHLFPPDWYLKAIDGRDYLGPYNQERFISPWNPEAWAYHLGFITNFCKRVSADDVMCFRTTSGGAESMFPQHFPYRLDGPYWETMRRVLLEEQEIFYNAHDSHELWTCFHHAFDYLGTAGTEYAEELYKEMRNRFPDHRHYSISYTQFRNDVGGEDKNREEMQRLGLSMFGGSEYAEGLLTNTDTAIQQGFRGFITGPLHQLTAYRKMEEWMFDNFRYSMNKWREAKRV